MTDLLQSKDWRDVYLGVKIVLRDKKYLKSLYWKSNCTPRYNYEYTEERELQIGPKDDMCIVRKIGNLYYLAFFGRHRGFRWYRSKMLPGTENYFPYKNIEWIE